MDQVEEMGSGRGSSVLLVYHCLARCSINACWGKEGREGGRSSYFIPHSLLSLEHARLFLHHLSTYNI